MVLRSEVTRAHIGCGSIRPLDWVNFDLEEHDQVPFVNKWDVRKPLGGPPAYDYAVCSFMLQELDHHELPGALENIKAILKQPTGVLRVLVADIPKAFAAYSAGYEDWFPQDARTGDLDAKFCSYVTWFGTARSVFTERYLKTLLEGAGFWPTRRLDFGETGTLWPEITELDSREPEALIMEAYL